MAKFDPSVPSIARIYDYVLGGKDNFPADRAQADQALAYNPLIPVMARENRQFLSRAVGWMTRQGIDQFIDIGCGLPTQPNTHESARAVRPEVMVAYVDNDPVVIGHLNALVAKGNPGIGVLAGDVREPDRVLDGVAETTDLAKPAVILGSLLHFISPDEAQDLVARYAAALAVGSYLVVSAARMESSGADGVTANTQGTSPRSTTTRRPTSPVSSARSNWCRRVSSTPAAGTRRRMSRPPRRRATPTCSPPSPRWPVTTHWIIPNRLRPSRRVLQPGAATRVDG